MKRLEGKAIIVTGGGSGIGKGACLRIAAEGGLVAVADLRAPLAEEIGFITGPAILVDGGCLAT